MIDGLGVHATDHTDLVGHIRNMRDQLTNPRTAFAVLGEFEHRRSDRKAALARRHRGQPLSHANAIR